MLFLISGGVHTGVPRLECGTAHEVSSPHSALIRQSA
jgi:hypothetical protein